MGIWEGVFTTQQAEGAILNGTRVQKCASEPDDGHGDGDLGTVVGSMGPFDPSQALIDIDPRFNCSYGYFIEWDASPGLPVFTAGFKVRELVH